MSSLSSVAASLLPLPMQDLLLGSPSDRIKKLVLLLVDFRKSSDMKEIEALVEEFVIRGIDLNAYAAISSKLLNPPPESNHDSKTLLSWAARTGDTGLVQLFLNKGADVNAVDEIGRTPLMEAARLGYTEVMQLLLKNGAKADAVDNTDTTVMAWAIRHRPMFSWSAYRPIVPWSAYRPVLELLVKHIDDPKVLHTSVTNALFYCILAYDANECFESGGALKDYHNRFHSTIEYLIEKGADVNAVFLLNKSTPLLALTWRWASKPVANTAWTLTPSRSYRNIADLLLQNGADPYVRNAQLKTPLIKAIERGHEEVAMLLLRRGVSFDSIDDQRRYEWFVTPFILELKARMNIRGPTGRTRLINECMAALLLSKKPIKAEQRAVLMRQVNHIITLHVEHGAEVNAADNDGNTPLMFAAQHEAGMYAAKLLLEHGADKTLRNRKGMTAYDIQHDSYGGLASFLNPDNDGAEISLASTPTSTVRTNLAKDAGIAPPKRPPAKSRKNSPPKPTAGLQRSRVTSITRVAEEPLAGAGAPSAKPSPTKGAKDSPPKPTAGLQRSRVTSITRVAEEPLAGAGAPSAKPSPTKGAKGSPPKPTAGTQRSRVTSITRVVAAPLAGAGAPNVRVSPTNKTEAPPPHRTTRREPGAIGAVAKAGAGEPPSIEEKGAPANGATLEHIVRKLSRVAEMASTAVQRGEVPATREAEPKKYRAGLEEKFIEQNKSLQEYYFTFQSILCSVFTALHSIHSNLVSDERVARSSLFSSGVSTGLDIVKTALEEVSTIGALFITRIGKYVIDARNHNKSLRIVKMAPNVSQMDKIVEFVARKTAIAARVDIAEPKRKTVTDRLSAFNNFVVGIFNTIHEIEAQWKDSLITTDAQKLAAEHAIVVIKGILEGEKLPEGQGLGIESRLLAFTKIARKEKSGYCFTQSETLSNEELKAAIGGELAEESAPPSPVMLVERAPRTSLSEEVRLPTNSDRGSTSTAPVDPYASLRDEMTSLNRKHSLLEKKVGKITKGDSCGAGGPMAQTFATRGESGEGRRRQVRVTEEDSEERRDLLKGASCQDMSRDELIDIVKRQQQEIQRQAMINEEVALRLEELELHKQLERNHHS